MNVTMMDWIQPRVQNLSDMVFFKTVLDYLRAEIAYFGLGLMEDIMTWVGGAALVLMTLWILIQGYRIVTGQAKDSMALMMVNAAKAAFIVTVATSMAIGSLDLHDFLTVQVKNEISQTITGDDDTIEEQIDKNLAWMQVAMGSIDVLDVASDPVLDEAKTRALWFSGIGMGGPALVAGSLLLMYEVALALFIGFGPIFILMLLFDATKQMFWKWLWLGIGTIFSMSILAVMVTISMKMVAKVAAAYWTSSLAGSLLGVQVNDGMTSVAMQQGGLGLILTTLIISTPPMAAMFFQGTVGQFAAYNSMGAFAGAGAANSAMRPGPGGQMVPAGGGYVSRGPLEERSSAPSRGGQNVSDTDLTAQNAVRRVNSAPAQTEPAQIPQKPWKNSPPPTS